MTMLPPERGAGAREAALSRARAHSPFLRDGSEARQDISAAFIVDGAAAACALAIASEYGGSLDARLRRQRQALALAVALGDLAGELTLEEVTQRLSDFA